jgi:hypothetical protein
MMKYRLKEIEQERAERRHKNKGEGGRPPMWSSGQSSCLQIQRPGLDSRR